MFTSIVSGNLTSDVEVAFSNEKVGKTYKIRMATNRVVYRNGQYEKETVWVSGLISEKKVGKILQYLKKGKNIICVSTQSGISAYTDKTGQAKASLEMGYVDKLELGGLAVKKEETEPEALKSGVSAQAPEELEFPL